MKPDGIHFEPGRFNPGLNFPIFLDLSTADPEKFQRELEKGWYTKALAEELFGKPIRKLPGRINYKIHNYCAVCKIKYPKGTYRCNNCNKRCRTKAWASNYSRKKNQK